MDALAQHYGFATHLMDLTNDFKAALFFATCKYVPETDSYRPLTQEAIDKSIQTLESKFKKVVDDFKGVWIDKKTFNIYYWTFFGMLEITLMSVALLIYYWVKFGAPWNC